jgi:hypothetical protein
MPITPPTYGAAYNQTEQNTNASAITAFIDTSNTNIATNKTAAVAGLRAAQAHAKLTTGLLSVDQQYNDAIAAFA